MDDYREEPVRLCCLQQKSADLLEEKCLCPCLRGDCSAAILDMADYRSPADEEGIDFSKHVRSRLERPASGFDPEDCAKIYMLTVLAVAHSKRFNSAKLQLREWQDSLLAV